MFFSDNEAVKTVGFASNFFPLWLQVCRQLEYFDVVMYQIMLICLNISGLLTAHGVAALLLLGKEYGNVISHFKRLFKFLLYCMHC
jgi:hypothetical protein